MSGLNIDITTISRELVNDIIKTTLEKTVFHQTLNTHPEYFPDTDKQLLIHILKKETPGRFTITPLTASDSQLEIHFFSAPEIYASYTIEYTEGSRWTIQYLNINGAQEEMPHNSFESLEQLISSLQDTSETPPILAGLPGLRTPLLSLFPINPILWKQTNRAVAESSLKKQTIKAALLRPCSMGGPRLAMTLKLSTDPLDSKVDNILLTFTARGNVSVKPNGLAPFYPSLTAAMSHITSKGYEYLSHRGLDLSSLFELPLEECEKELEKLKKLDLPYTKVITLPPLDSGKKIHRALTFISQLPTLEKINFIHPESFINEEFIMTLKDVLETSSEISERCKDLILEEILTHTPLIEEPDTTTEASSIDTTYFNSEKFSDFTIHTTDGYSIPAHRIVLSLNSEYFDVLCSSSMLEGATQEITLEEPKEVTLTILAWFYKKQTPTPDLIIPTIIAAEKYRILDLVEVCEKQVALGWSETIESDEYQSVEKETKNFLQTILINALLKKV
jgi:hypothetical protein